MAAAEKFHSEAQEDVYNLLEEMIEESREDLDGTRFKVLFKHGGWKSKGKIVFGKVKVLSDDMRFGMQKDAIIYLNSDQWKQMSDKQKKYVLDSTLYALVPKYDKHDDVKFGKDGFPLLTTIPYDIEAFADVIRRHGVVMEEVQLLSRALKEVNQVTIDDLPDQEEQKQLPKDHEGISGKINQDGTVEVTAEEEDPNQTKIDDYLNEGKSESGLDVVTPIDTTDDELPF